MREPWQNRYRSKQRISVRQSTNVELAQWQLCAEAAIPAKLAFDPNEASARSFWRAPLPNSKIASSLRCGRSWFTHSASLAGYLRGQLIHSGEEQLENRRGVCLAVTHGQIDRWCFTLQRTADHGPRQQVVRIGRQQRQPAGGRHQGHGL